MAIGINFDDDYRPDDRDLGPAFWNHHFDMVEQHKALQRWRHRMLRDAKRRAHKAIEEFLKEDSNTH